jgi:hypothetical protein
MFDLDNRISMFLQCKSEMLLISRMIYGAQRSQKTRMNRISYQLNRHIYNDIKQKNMKNTEIQSNATLY